MQRSTRVLRSHRDQHSKINDERNKQQHLESDAYSRILRASFGASLDPLNASDGMGQARRLRSASRKQQLLEPGLHEHESVQSLDAPDALTSRRRQKIFNSSGAKAPSTDTHHATHKSCSAVREPSLKLKQRLFIWISFGLEVLRNVVNLCLRASRTVTTKPGFRHVVALILIFLICVVVLAGALAGVQSLVEAACAAGLVSKSIHCSYPGGGATVQWLGYSCDSTSPGLDIFDTLDKTATEIDQWANVSSLILPHSNYLRTADLALAKQQRHIKSNSVTFPDKDALDETMTAFGEGLLMAGDEIFTTVLNAEMIVFLMLDHLNGAEHHLKYASGAQDQSHKKSSLWSWHTTYRVTSTLNKLLTDLDDRLMDLIHLIETCKITIERAERVGAIYGMQTRNAQQYVQSEMEKKRKLVGLFSINGLEHKMRESLIAFFFPLPEILEHLQRARDSLILHRQSLRGARVDFLSIHVSLTASGPNAVLLQLVGTIRRLASTKTKMEIEYTRNRERFDAERSSGQYYMPRV